MNLRPIPVIGLFLSLCGGLSCRAPSTEEEPPLRILSIQVGIPPGPRQGDDDPARKSNPLFKVGHWTPVVVTVSGSGQVDQAKLTVQTTDCDDVLNDVVISLPRLDFSVDKPQRKLLTYCRPGKSDAALTVTIETPTTTIRSVLADVMPLDHMSYLYATLGPRLPNLRMPSYENPRARHSEVGAWDSADDLPTRWLGYDSIDLAILSTSNAAFLTETLNDPERRTALLEWVRRGGKLVLCVGQNQDLLQAREDLHDLLPVEFTGIRSIPRGNVQWPGSAVLDDLGDPERQKPVVLATMKFKPERNVRRLATFRPEEGGELPLVVQAAYGSGRVTIVATDPDQPPFSLWRRQGDFWERVLRNSGPKFALPSNNEGLVATAFNTNFSRLLQTSLESFRDVPVIGFSWVALLILLYIVVIGPLDYLLLKRVFKQLERTWVTFPLVVLTVCLATYLTALALKGDDLRIQKVDVVDFDLEGHTATGWSWFSVFSPSRLDFNIQVEPSSKWGLTGHVSSPDITALGEARVGRQSLFRRSYRFDFDDGSLRDVPISVWSVKSFQARWHQNVDRSSPPLLTTPPHGQQRSGGQHHIPFAGDDSTGDVVPPRQRISTWQARTGADSASHTRGSNLFPRLVGDTTDYGASPGRGELHPVEPSPHPAARSRLFVIQSLVFHEFREAGTNVAATPRNAGFREIDQSWRLTLDDPGGSAIVFGHTDSQQSSYRQISQSEGTICRLILYSGATSEDSRDDGPMLQESYFRFFVPVRTIR